MIFKANSRREEEMFKDAFGKRREGELSNPHVSVETPTRQVDYAKVVQQLTENLRAPATDQEKR